MARSFSMKIKYPSPHREFDRKEWTSVLTSVRKSVNNMNIVDLAQNIRAENFLSQVKEIAVESARAFFCQGPWGKILPVTKVANV